MITRRIGRQARQLRKYIGAMCLGSASDSDLVRLNVNYVTSDDVRPICKLVAFSAS